MSEQNQKLDRIIELLEVLVRINLSNVVEKEINDAKKKKLYQLTGQKQRKELVGLTGLSAGSISSLWQRWHSMGILRKNGKFYYKVVEEEEENGD